MSAQELRKRRAARSWRRAARRLAAPPAPEAGRLRVPVRESAPVRREDDETPIPQSGLWLGPLLALGVLELAFIAVLIRIVG